MQTLTNLFSNTSPVVIVANNNLPDNPIVTPLLNSDNSPKIDLAGKPLGSIRLGQMTRSIAGGSFMNVRNRVAFIGGTYEELMALVEQNKLVDGTQLPGRIQVTESLEPFWKGQQPKINPITTDTVGIQIGENFYPVYLRMLYTEDMNAKDKYIRSAEDVNEWYSIRKTLSSTPTQPVVETAHMPQG